MTRDIERQKAALAADPRARLRWRVLRAFGVLPHERRARRLTDRQIVECALHMILDLGGPVWAGEENPAFDERRFEELRAYDTVGHE